MIEYIRPGLARWVTPHPEWNPEDDVSVQALLARRGRVLGRRGRERR